MELPFTLKRRKKNSKKCAVLGCVVSEDDVRRFFRFPKANGPHAKFDKLIKWISLCGNESYFYDLSVERFICGNHFEKKYSHKRVLEPNVMPSQNLPDPVPIPPNVIKNIDCPTPVITQNINLPSKQISADPSQITYNECVDGPNLGFGKVTYTSINYLNIDCVPRGPVFKVPEIYENVDYLDDNLDNSDDNPDDCNDNPDDENVDYLDDNLDNSDDNPDDYLMDIEVIDESFFEESIDQSRNISPTTTNIVSQTEESDINDRHSNTQEPLKTLINESSRKRKRDGKKTIYLKNVKKNTEPNDEITYEPLDDSSVQKTAIEIVKESDIKSLQKETNKSTQEVTSADKPATKGFTNIDWDNEDPILLENASLMCHDYCNPDMDSLCRLCGNVQKDKDALIEIFGYKTRVNIYLTKYFPYLNIDTEKKLPKKACRKCVKFLRRVLSFVRTVQRVDNRLCEMYGIDSESKATICPDKQEKTVLINHENGSKTIKFKSNRDFNSLEVNFLISRQGNGMFCCPFCDKTVRSKYQMTTHITLVHVNSNDEIREDITSNKKKSKKKRKEVVNNSDVAPVLQSFCPIVPEVDVYLPPVPMDVNSGTLLNENVSLNPSLNSNDCTILETVIMDNKTELPTSNNELPINPISSQNFHNTEGFVFRTSYSMPDISEPSTQAAENQTYLGSCVELRTGDSVGQNNEEIDYENISMEALLVTSKKKKTYQVGKNIKCEKCDKAFTKRIYLLKHEESAHGVIRKCYKCTICFEAFASAFLLSTHTTSIHGSSLEEESIQPVTISCLYECQYCCRLYIDFQQILSHKTTCSAAETKTYICYCSKKFNLFKNFPSHLATHEDSSDPLLERPVCCIINVCDYCNAVYNSMLATFIHKKRNHSMEIAEGIIAKTCDAINDPESSNIPKKKVSRKRKHRC